MKRKLFAAACLGIGGVVAAQMITGAAAAGTAAGTAAEQKPVSAVETGAPENERKVYGIGSTSKVFTAAAVMRLAEEGLIEMDAPLINYIPDFYMADARYKEITPRMLINHSSGLPGSSLSNTLLYGDPDTYHHDTLLTQLRTLRLKADPGAYSVYCNDGFTLAEILVERVTKQSFTDYLAANFWGPMGLASMGTSQSIREGTNLADVYFKGNASLPFEYANVIGSGGMYGTAEDLSQAGQMFVHQPKEAFQVLSNETVKAMELPAYTVGYGLDPGVPSTMGYGLGWDSVASPAFAGYGITALSKGGDTKNYHSMLTVLPELNMSCAVLSSGGSSTYNSLVAREIMLIYLEEMGQIEREDSLIAEGWYREDRNLAELPTELRKYEGWYVGFGVYRVYFSERSTLMIESSGTKRDTVQEYYYLGNNRFVSKSGTYIDATGQLVSAQAGIRGTTILTLQEEKDGLFLGMVSSEIIPALGEEVLNFPLARKCSPQTLSGQVLATWKARAGKEYLLVNEKYTSSNYLEYSAVRPMLYDGFEGYLGETEGNFIARIVDANHAEFFLRLPGQAGRDLIDIELYKKDGVEYLRGRYLYVEAESVPAFSVDMETIVIGEDGLTRWFMAGNDLSGHTVTIDAPADGNFYIYTYVDDEMTCVAGSIIGDSGTGLYIPEGARIAFAGDPGAVFVIRADITNYALQSVGKE